MRKLSLLILVFLQSFCSVAQEKAGYEKAVENYFKISPFANNTDTLIKQLLEDPDLVVDTIVYPTDTSLFYLRGYYKKFNPFSENIKTVELLFYYSGVNGGSNRKYMLVYKIVGILNQSNNNKQKAIDEEGRIFGALKNSFRKTEYHKSGRKAQWPSGIHYYQYGVSMPVFSSWGVWYKTKTDFCVSLEVNLSSLLKTE